MKHNRLAAALAALILALGATACAPASQAPAASQGGQAAAFPGSADPELIVYDMTSEPVTLDPMQLKDGIALSVMRHFMAGLTRLDANDVPQPDVAESWTPNEDNTVYTVRLRTDAVWSNGDPVTARDFYYSWISQMTKSFGSTYAVFLYANIKNGEAFYNGEVPASELGLKLVDDYTLEVTWARPLSPEAAGFFFAFPTYLPANQAAYEAIGGEQYGQSADTLVTNGPYRLTEWVRDDHILLERSGDYKGVAKVEVPKLKLVMIGDANTRLNAFMAGELDICNLTGDQIDQVKARDPSAVASYIDGGSWYLSFNGNRPLLANANLRRALAYSVDVQSLLDNVIRDGSVAADGLVPHAIAGVGGPYADARGSLCGYDPEAAKGYLEAALSELGMAAADLKLALLTNDSTYGQNQAAYLQQQWKKNLGLDVAVDVLAWKARIEMVNAGDYDMLVVGWGPSENDAITFLENYTSYSPNNEIGFANDEYDRLLTEAVAEGDPARRQELLIQAETLLIDQMAVGPLYFTCTTYAVSSKLEGLARTPFQLFNFCDGARIVTPN